MTLVEQLQWLFLIDLCIWVLVGCLTFPAYVMTLRRDGILPYVSGLLVLSVANVLETGYFTWVIWFATGQAQTDFALRLIPIAGILRGISIAAIVWFAIRSGGRRTRRVTRSNRDAE